MGLEATEITELTGVSRNSVNRILNALRKRMAEQCESEAPSSGEIEVDELYLGARRVRGRRGRGSGGKTSVFGVIRRQGKGLRPDRPLLQEDTPSHYMWEGIPGQCHLQ